MNLKKKIKASKNKNKFTFKALKEDLNQISHQYYWKQENGAMSSNF